MNFNPNTLNKLQEILNMNPGDTVIFNFGIITCHLGNPGRYIEIYDNEEKWKGSLLICLYDDVYELASDMCDVIFG